MAAGTSVLQDPSEAQKRADAPDSGDAVSYRQPPSNVEAEQALLGAILVNNEALHHIGDQLRPEHFYEPVHQRIFDAIIKHHDRGQIANPVTLRHYFDRDESLADILRVWRVRRSMSSTSWISAA